MNEFSSYNPAPPPIASPTEESHYQTEFEQSGWVATAFGHFLWFGFLGQIAFTLSLFFIPSGSRGAINHTALSADHWLNLVLCLPGLGAFSGLSLSVWKPLNALGDSFRMLLTFLAICVLGVIDLFGLIIWSWPGYC